MFSGGSKTLTCVSSVMVENPLGLILQAELERHIDEHRILGAVAVVSVPGKGRFQLAAGFEDQLKIRRIKPAARFLIYSITKIFIGTAVVRLAQQKCLALDDQLSSWFPEIDVASGITIRQLLTHTSGFPDYGALSNYQRAVDEGPQAPWSFHEFLQQTCPNGLAFEPGQGWAYSNIGYMFLAKIIERVTRSSLSHALQTAILTPLQLSATSLVATPDDLKALTPGYSNTKGGDRMRDVREWYHPGWVAHGVLASTADEVNQFLEALFAGRLLDAEYLTEMLNTVPVPGHPPTVQSGYGLGIASETHVAFGTHYGHEGSGPGFRLIASHAPKVVGTTITVFCNNDQCSSRTISDSLMHTVCQSV